MAHQSRSRCLRASLILAALCLLQTIHASSACADPSEPLTLERALERALEPARFELVGAAARAAVPAAVFRSPWELEGSVARSGRGFAGGEERRMGLELSRRLDLWGRQSFERAASVADRDAARHDHASARQRIASEVRRAFHEVAWADRRAGFERTQAATVYEIGRASGRERV